MRHIFLLLCVVVSLRAVDLPPGVTVTVNDHPETPGVLSYAVTSPYQTGTNQVEVLLPDQLVPDRHYPVVYCLPVNAGTKGNWGHPLTEARAHDLANRHQTIFVCPAYAILPWFGDNPLRPEFRQNQYLLDVVIPLIESRHPAIAEPRGRFLVGFSKSGQGALSLFLRDPDHFARIAIYETWFGQPNAKQFAEWGFTECYGTRENYDRYDAQLLLGTDVSKRLAKEPTRIIVGCGGPGLRLGVDMLTSILKQRQIPFTYVLDSSWSHTWTSGWLPIMVAALNPSDLASSSTKP